MLEVADELAVAAGAAFAAVATDARFKARRIFRRPAWKRLFARTQAMLMHKRMLMR